MKTYLSYCQPIDLGEYGDFLPKAVDYEPGNLSAIIYGEYAPLELDGSYGKSYETEIYVEFNRPIHHANDIYTLVWKYWEIY